MITVPVIIEYGAAINYTNWNHSFCCVGGVVGDAVGIWRAGTLQVETLRFLKCYWDFPQFQQLQSAQIFLLLHHFVKMKATYWVVVLAYLSLLQLGAAQYPATGKCDPQIASNKNTV